MTEGLLVPVEVESDDAEGSGEVEETGKPEEGQARQGVKGGKKEGPRQA